MRQSQRQREIHSGTDAIALSAVTHGFESTSVLEDVTLSVNQGEILAIIGPSGTGKTTLLRLLSLFEQPEEGSLTIDGTDVWSLSERDRVEKRRQVGMVFQEANLFDASVRRNVSYGLRVRQDWRHRIHQWLTGFVDEETPEPVTETLEIVGMADAETRDVASLSGGEAQRVAFARAVAYEPEFLLLDEPTSDLDPRNTAVLEDAMETACREDIGIAIATHDMHQAERVADRVAVLLDGQVIEVGPADRVFSDPDDPRASKFIDGELVY